MTALFAAQCILFALLCLCSSSPVQARSRYRLRTRSREVDDGQHSEHYAVPEDAVMDSVVHNDQEVDTRKALLARLYRDTVRLSSGFSRRALNVSGIPGISLAARAARYAERLAERESAEFAERAGDSDPGSIGHASSTYQRLVASPLQATSGSAEADTQIAAGVSNENFSSEGFVSDSASVGLESTQQAEHAVTSSLAAQDAAYSSDGDNSAVEAYQDLPGSEEFPGPGVAERLAGEFSGAPWFDRDASADWRVDAPLQHDSTAAGAATAAAADAAAAAASASDADAAYTNAAAAAASGNTYEVAAAAASNAHLCAFDSAANSNTYEAVNGNTYDAAAGSAGAVEPAGDMHADMHVHEALVFLDTGSVEGGALVSEAFGSETAASAGNADDEYKHLTGDDLKYDPEDLENTDPSLELGAADVGTVDLDAVHLDASDGRSHTYTIYGSDGAVTGEVDDGAAMSDGGDEDDAWEHANGVEDRLNSLTTRLSRSYDEERAEDSR